MFCKLFVIIVALKIHEIYTTSSQYLETESHKKPKLEKTNVMNKGVWVRNHFERDGLPNNVKTGEFIFKENSMDVEGFLRNNFDAFGGSFQQESPFVPVYADRHKRSNSHKRDRKSIIGSNFKTSLNRKYINTDSERTKFIDDSKPTGFFSDYPYEVAFVVTGNTSNENNINSKILKADRNNSQTQSNFYSNKTVVELTTVSMDTEIKNDNNDSNKNISSPKRSMKYDYETEVIKKFEITEDLNRTDDNVNSDSKIIDRNVFDKEDSEWHQSAPIPDVNIYKVVPKEPMQKSKPVTERGLLKVISMLTKTLKKIIKQHSEIKNIYSKITDIGEDFKKNVMTFTSKFQDFDVKYLYLMQLYDKIKEIESKLDKREQYFLNREKDTINGFKEFENQQKKFLLQQKQFYNIQKLMLAQNEKINLKQNSIAKTQSEISQRQNNFARVLKKAKQLYIDSRNPITTKLSSSISKTKETTYRPHEPSTMQTSTRAVQIPESTTDSIKINLFSIPTPNKIQEDPDDLLLKEKDEQAIDDLVYKYYFNNTFIDNFMRNTILNNFMGNGVHNGNIRIANRRHFERTLLSPILETNESEIGHNRKRRWINRHQSRHQRRHKKFSHNFNSRVNTPPAATIATTDKPNHAAAVDSDTINNQPTLNTINNQPEVENLTYNNPFLTMAQTFCNQMHQNITEQILGWCIEKALRKLQYLETKIIPISRSSQELTPNFMQPPPFFKINKLLGKQQKAIANQNPLQSGVESTTQTTTFAIVSDATTASQVPQTFTLQTLVTAYKNGPENMEINSDVFHFPDNDDLELKLSQYELKPDTEGNVYYDGSFHESDLKALSDSGADDVMPGLDSNSRIQVDPMTFDVQAARRAFMRKLHQKTKKAVR